MFEPEICKNGICTNLFSSYSCYCQNGYYYDNIRLECVGEYFISCINTVQGTEIERVTFKGIPQIAYELLMGIFKLLVYVLLCLL